MNRPTSNVDDLVEMADEAIAESDFSQAVNILRKAAAVAPLRKDIRNRLAVALEGTPVPRKASKSREVMRFEDSDLKVHFDDGLSYDGESKAQGDGSGREAIGLIAKKAFDAAAGQTARAGVATRNLTNLLQHGIQTWKSSLIDQVKITEPTPYNPVKAVKNPVLHVSDTTRAEVFGVESELVDYLNRTNSTTGHPDVEIDGEGHEAAHHTFLRDSVRETSPASGKKSGRPTSGKKTGARQTDVEDVLAAGIDGFIEALGRANKRKIAFTTVYVALGAFFTYACFDVSKKFPAVNTLAGESVMTASMGHLNLAQATTNDEAIIHAKKLTEDGKVSEAIAILKAQLESGILLKNRDQIRVELATLLNSQAEAHLTNNRMSDSVSAYREALKILPADAALQLRLANALYYMGTLSDSDQTTKQTALSDAKTTLKALVSKASDNLQTHRLLGLVHEAQGEQNLARLSWQKVRALAPSNSAESKEAASHLK